MWSCFCMYGNLSINKIDMQQLISTINFNTGLSLVFFCALFLCHLLRNNEAQQLLFSMGLLGFSLFYTFGNLLR